MNDVTRILSRYDGSNSELTHELFQLVYDELRQIATAKMRSESVGNSSQPTALVHEAFIRLVDRENPQAWDCRGHFFAAAAEAMRRILVESARRRSSAKRGGKLQRVDIEGLATGGFEFQDQIIDIDDTLSSLAAEDSVAAELVKLRLFAGLSITEAGEMLGMSRTSAYENWKFARAWFAARVLS